MEIALNILWLSLLLPALWVYRWRRPDCSNQVRFSRLEPILILACVLVLLFPVISATDDLHAMRFEMEEPGPQRWVKQLDVEQSCSVFRSGNTLIRLASSLCGQRHETVCGRVYLAPLPFAGEVTVSEFASRAPPEPVIV
jgi:hypothetical protein